jgi:geranylgeranyl diphosphate synthase type II
MRRGRPTVHHVFGEATALLAGDGLMLLAVETLAHSCAAHPSAGVRPVIRLLEAANARTGLVAGQAWELETRADVSVYHRAKTAALFEVAASLGALASGQDPSPFARFGLAFGMAYQHADDVADVFGSAEDLGKATGRDRELGRPSAVPSGSSRRLALQTLRKAAERVVDDVPTCPGDAALRNFTTAVFASLEKQCQAEQTNP